ncbi:hypothetical protein GTO10_05760 [Candidatus Saccharibacteria bacterium]|nr:hypothetical protein [Candidatus Saccharibacteria bacterium]
MVFKKFAKIVRIFGKWSPRKRELLSLGRFKTWAKRRGILSLYAAFILVAPFAQVSVAHAPLLPKPVEAKVDTRPTQLKVFLNRYNSPLAANAGTFIRVADKYGFDWRFLPAIAGTESTFGLKYVRGTYNPFGWGGGRIRFSSWDHAIEHVGRTLWERYLLSGQLDLSIEQIGAIYATSSHWPKSVRYWMGKIDSPQTAALVK